MAGMGLSGGFAAGAGADALEELLKRAFIEQSEKRRAAQEDQRIAQEGERLKMAAADRTAAQNDLAQSRAIQNAGRIAGNLRIGQTVQQPTIDALAAGNLGDLVQHEGADLPSQAISGIADVGAKAPVMGRLRMTAAGRPERDTFTGTAEQLANEQTRQDALKTRADAAAERAAAREDTQKAAMEMQRQRAADAENQARIVAGLRGGNADLQREILQGKVDAARDKAAETQQKSDAARQAALASIDDTSSALDELLDEKGNLKPGAAGAFGADSMLGIIPGTSYADARARRDRLQSRLTIDLLGEMKRQSRTGASGFGALSEKELAVLQNAAARLQSSQSDESARQALLDVRKQLMGMRQRAAGGASAAPKDPLGIR